MRNVAGSASDAAVATVLLWLAKTFGIVVAADGIERPAPLERRRNRAGDESQDILLSPLLSVAELQAWYRRAPGPRHAGHVD